MKYGTEQRAWWPRVIVQYVLRKHRGNPFSGNAPPPPKDASHFSSVINPLLPQGRQKSGKNYKKWEIGDENLHHVLKFCLPDLVLTPPPLSDRYVEDRDAEEEKIKNKKKILKAQTLAATLMQPCLARNTLLYHLLYKYTAFFLT